ncbi:MAG: trypsin-like peptidase domain-containing protein [Pirellulales bacterium]|nr:trypsin-like peptidase domain-containing protein [Pirellulales bacterium]
MTPVVKAFQGAKDSVVNIRGEKTVEPGDTTADPSEVGRRVNGMGTGIVIDERGYVITNHHVVNGVAQIKVILADKRQCAARLIARDRETDLAIIKIDLEEKLPVIRIGKSSDLMTGEPVIAVGNAYGYEHTVTRGIISALHRAVQVSDAQFYGDLIQTDASINPGNSGGPLLNIDGDMIGINVAVRAGAQGIGFAIPIDKAMAVASELLAERQLKKTRHGFALKQKSSDDEEKGLVVSAVEDKSPADEAGLKAGDTITRLGDFDLARPLDLQRALMDRQPGDKLEVAVQRGDKKLTLDLTLVAADSLLAASDRSSWEVLGMELEVIPANIFLRKFKKQHSTPYRGGLEVTSVRPESPAAEQGIRRGDVLVGMHVWETVSIENVNYILKRPDLGRSGPVRFYILRGNETLYGDFSLSMRDKGSRR